MIRETLSLAEKRSAHKTSVQIRDYCMQLAFQNMCVASTDVFQSYQRTQPLYFLTLIGVR